MRSIFGILVIIITIYYLYSIDLKAINKNIKDDSKIEKDSIKCFEQSHKFLSHFKDIKLPFSVDTTLIRKIINSKKDTITDKFYNYVQIEELTQYHYGKKRLYDLFYLYKFSIEDEKICLIYFATPNKEFGFDINLARIIVGIYDKHLNKIKHFELGTIIETTSFCCLQSTIDNNYNLNLILTYEDFFQNKIYRKKVKINLLKDSSLSVDVNNCELKRN